MSEQGALFSLAEVGVSEAEYTDRRRRSASPAGPRPPVTGVRWRRTALRKDCTGCWEQQDREFKAGNPLHSTRRPASAELTMWDDDGNVIVSAFYCTAHAEGLGWDSSRAKDRKKRPSGLSREEIARRRLAHELNDLVAQARRGSSTRAWQQAVTTAIGRAGGANLEQPSWGVTSSGSLIGSVTGPVKRILGDWADVFGGDIETEKAPGETRLHLTCRVVPDPAVEVWLSGSLDRHGTAL